jgi:hypothetical protein
MDGLRELLMDLRRHGLARGNFRGLLNVFVGRRIETESGQVLCSGLTFREMAELLKRVRWEKAAAGELGVDAANLPPRDRVRYWYLSMARAQIDSEEASKDGDRLVEVLRARGYKVGPPPKATKGA